MSKKIDLTGRRFGLLVVIDFAGSPDGRGRWNCRCDCGKASIVRGESLRKGDSSSCGCYKQIKATTHGHSSRKNHGRMSPTYSTWLAMRYRCGNPGNSGYTLYGARGIKVCERWQKFENFLVDMGEKPKGMSIDRIDSAGNYEPNNCRWATPAQQSRNTRATHLNEELAKQIRLAPLHETTASVARRLGVSYSAAAYCRRGETWAVTHAAA